MAERTKEQILEEAVYAVACVVQHYGPELNEEGLDEVRELLSNIDFSTDATYRVDVNECSQYADFHKRIIWPKDWDKLEIQNSA